MYSFLCEAAIANTKYATFQQDIDTNKRVIYFSASQRARQQAAECFLTVEPTGTPTAAQMHVYNTRHGINDHMMCDNKTQKGKKKLILYRKYASNYFLHGFKTPAQSA